MKPLYSLIPRLGMMMAPELSFGAKIRDLFCNQKYVLLLCICFFERFSQSVYNISIGIFIKESYGANPLQLGLYATMTQGVAQLIGVTCIAAVFGRFLRKNYFIALFAIFQLTAYIVFYGMFCGDTLNGNLRGN